MSEEGLVGVNERHAPRHGVSDAEGINADELRAPLDPL